MNSKNVRIKDIAEMAGVSVGTVDRVIHKRGKVSQEALDKIMAVLKKTGYKPNLLARTLGSNKKYFIAALVPDPSLDEYWQHSVLGIEDAQHEWSQYNIGIKTFYYDLYDKTSFEKTAKTLLEANPDAILTSPIFHHEAVDFFKNINGKSIPYVFFNSNIPEAKPLSFIGQNFYQSGKLGAELLDISTQAIGNYAILHVYEDIHNSVHLAQKEKGFVDYFNEKKNKDIKVLTLDYSNPDNDALEKDLNNLLSEHKINGLFVSTSKGAHLTASFLEKIGKREIRLVGYDLLKENIEYLKKGTIDFLIHQNPRRMASLGIGYLANHLLFKKESPAEDLFPLEIITRQNLQSFLIK